MTTTSARTKEALLVAPDLRGRAYAAAHSDAADAWLADLFTRELGDRDGLALVAVGGYGRRELCPYSDLDVLLIHDDLDDYAEAAEALWYPVWDRGLKIGYAVVTLDQAATLATEELHWATAFLSSRLVAGSPGLADGLTEVTRWVWEEHHDDLLAQLADAIDERHERFGDVAFQIEPQLKEGRGGLRDVHGLTWAAQVSSLFDPDLAGELADAVDTLLEARVELHRVSGRAEELLTFDAQDDVAAALTAGSGQELMLRVALAARRISWHSDDAWSRWKRATGRATYRPITAEPIATEFGLVNGELALSPGVDVAADPYVVLRLAATAARTERTISRAGLAALAERGAPIPEPWPAEARRLFADLLLSGRPAITVIEDLDQFGLMERLLPEWEAVRCHPQRNAMHVFTIDRHLCETAVHASGLADRVTRPDLLVVGALLHDIGKGRPGDHTEVGMRLIETIASRMGYPDDDVAVLIDLCRHHLLLPDVATRRDLGDPGTIAAVAAAVDSVDFLHILASLTEADSIATGPSTWNSWRAGLLADLVHRTELVLEGEAPATAVGPDFPTPDVAERIEAGTRSLDGSGTTFTVVAPDEPALFSRLAGVLAVHGLDVLDAVHVESVRDDGPPMAACRFTLQPPAGGSVHWDDVLATAARALDGGVALTARIRRRARQEERFRRRLAAVGPRTDLVVDNDISATATVIEVHARDSVGLLYWVTQALTELRLDIRTAKIQTFGPQAVDSFYLTDLAGAKLERPEQLAELDLAIRNALDPGDEH
ncbi:MAG: [protein-PII] uridylyltransferase [Acidimicrobiales bacterium]